MTYLHSCIVHVLHISGKIRSDLELQERIFGKPKVIVGSYEPWGRCRRGEGGAGVNGVQAGDVNAHFHAICGILSDEKEKVLPI
jgi:hypothetical protein